MSSTEQGEIHPEPTVESKPFWDGLRAHRLMFQRCADCKKPRHYPRPMCSSCYSLRQEWFQASRLGHVHSWTVCHHAFHPRFTSAVPYVLVTADLTDGIRMVAPLVNATAGPLSLGSQVIVDYQFVDDALTVPKFRLTATPHANVEPHNR